MLGSGNRQAQWFEICELGSVIGWIDVGLYPTGIGMRFVAFRWKSGGHSGVDVLN